jgi:hypothetical protein
MQTTALSKRRRGVTKREVAEECLVVEEVGFAEEGLVVEVVVVVEGVEVVVGGALVVEPVVAEVGAEVVEVVVVVRDLDGSRFPEAICTISKGRENRERFEKGGGKERGRNIQMQLESELAQTMA